MNSSNAIESWLEKPSACRRVQKSALKKHTQKKELSVLLRGVFSYAVSSQFGPRLPLRDCRSGRIFWKIPKYVDTDAAPYCRHLEHVYLEALHLSLSRSISVRIAP